MSKYDKNTRRLIDLRVNSIINIIRLTPDGNVEDMIKASTKNDPPLVEKLVRKELNKFRLVIENVCEDICIEDGGCAKIAMFSDEIEDENGISVRVVSWDNEKKHTEFDKLKGKKVRITIEEIE